MAAEESKISQKKMVNSSTYVDVNQLQEITEQSQIENNNQLLEAGKLFKEIIMDDFMGKHSYAAKKGYKYTYLYKWNTKDSPKFNNFTPFYIINKYIKSTNDGRKVKFMVELREDINKMHGTDITQFFIKYNHFKNKNFCVISSKVYTPRSKKEDKPEPKSKTESKSKSKSIPSKSKSKAKNKEEIDSGEESED